MRGVRRRTSGSAERDALPALLLSSENVDGRRVGASLSTRSNLWIGTLLPGEHEFRLELRAMDFKGYWKDTASVVVSSDLEIGR